MNTTIRKILLATAAAFVTAGTAHAVPISYEGTLVAGVASTGSINGFSWFLNQAGGVDFWSFTAVAGSDVTLKVNRLNANLDPALSLYRGTTSADASTFDSAASFGGMTYIGSLDDEAPPSATPGPNGDPLGTFHITTTGTYTVAVGGGLSTDAGAYPYSITMSVPEPASMLLLAGGLLVIGSARRKRT